MKAFIALTALLFVSPIWYDDFESAKKIAQDEHKYILLNFSGSDWCAPCIKLKKEVFENPAFFGVTEKLVLVRADFPRSKKNQLSPEQTKRNEALAEQYNPLGKFPLTLLLDSKGKVIKVWDGYVFGSQDKFIDEVEKTITSL